MRLSGGLRKDQRGLRGCGGKQRSNVRCAARQLLSKELQRIHVAVREGADYEFVSVRFRRFGQERDGLRFGEFFLGLFALLAKGSNLIERFTRLLRSIVNVGGEQRSGFGKRGEIAASGGYSALSGDEFYAPSLADFFSFTQQDASDLAGLVDVRAAAGADVQVVDVDEAEFVAFSRRELAQPELPCVLGSHEADLYRAILEDDFVGEALGGFDLIFGDRRRVQING